MRLFVKRLEAAGSNGGSNGSSSGSSSSSSSKCRNRNKSTTIFTISGYSEKRKKKRNSRY